MKAAWDRRAPDPDVTMMWASCCVAFLAFLRTAELTVPSDVAYDPEAHLSLGDITVDNSSAPTAIQIRIKQPLQEGHQLAYWKDWNSAVSGNSSAQLLD